MPERFFHSLHSLKPLLTEGISYVYAIWEWQSIITYPDLYLLCSLIVFIYRIALNLSTQIEPAIQQFYQFDFTALMIFYNGKNI
jgi:hypothetical protein